jgi:hypothetical protein
MKEKGCINYLEKNGAFIAPFLILRSRDAGQRRSLYEP